VQDKIPILLGMMAFCSLIPTTHEVAYNEGITRCINHFKPMARPFNLEVQESEAELKHRLQRARHVSETEKL
jgi:hypothetical protein